VSLWPNDAVSSVARYVTVEGYVPILLAEAGPKTVPQSWFVEVINGAARGQLGYEGNGLVTLVFEANGSFTASTGNQTLNLNLQKIV